jgi:LemA protein
MEGKKMVGGIVAIVIVVGLAGAVIGIYNSLIGLRNKVKEAFATMDVYLKKRWDLIPNLVETVKGYASHEKSTFEEVVKLRNTAYDDMPMEAKLEANEKMAGVLSRLFALAENYPELKANTNFLDLSTQLTKVEEDIAQSRKYYNAVVRALNDKVQMFPSNIVAGMFGFTEGTFFETAEAEREVVQVAF